MSYRTGMTVLALAALFAGPRSGWAQPSLKSPGCCCLPKGDTFACSEKTQADCLALEPAAPTFAKVEDWDQAVAASKAQEKKPMRGGWIAGPCRK